MPAVARPVGDGVVDLDADLLEVDVRVGPGVVDRRRQLVVLERQRHLGEAGRACGRLQVSHIGFHRAEQRGPVGGAALADDATERVGLDRVTEDGAGAVGLDVVDGARVDARVLVGLAQHFGLRVGVRREQPVGPAVVVDRTARDDGEDLVAVAAGVGHALEHQHAAALGAGVAVGVLREGLDPAVGRQHAADLVEADGDQRGDQRVDAAGQHHVDVAGAQRLDALVDGDQRRRAGGVDGHRRAAEVVEVGHPVGDDRARRAGDGVRVRDVGIGHRQEAVVVVGAADVDADVSRRAGSTPESWRAPTLPTSARAPSAAADRCCRPPSSTARRTRRRSP